MVDSRHDDDQTRSFIQLIPSAKVSHYTIISKIGAGGMGEVFLAEDSILKRQVALKFMPAHLASNSDMRLRFTREAQSAAKLDHPNIVPVYEVGEFEGRPFFSMAHIKGKSLKEVIQAGKLSITESIGLTRQICEGLHEAHSAGVVHRDIKPANIIIDKNGNARIVDFGLATVVGEDKLTKTGSTLGTVGYMSPEQIEGKVADHRADLFSLGVILYEMLTGRRPFAGDTDAAIVRAITSSTPEPIARFKSGVTSELQHLINKALTKDPTLRYQHADGMLADLKRLLSDSNQSFTTSDMSTADDKSILVIPLQNMSPDADNEYFSDGLTDEIITDLSGISEIRVLSRSTSMRLKGTTKDVRSIGRELGVRYILFGSVRKAGNNIRITAQLIEAAQDRQIWGEKFKGSLDDVFEIQENVSQAIASTLKIQLSGKEQERLLARPIENAGAYEYFLRAQAMMDDWGKFESYKKAEQYLLAAIEKTGDNATLYAGLAYVYFQYINFGFYGLDHVYKIREYLEKSLALDPLTPNALMVQGLLYSSLEGKPKEALDAFQKAYELSPNDTSIIVWLCVHNCILGRIDKANEFLEVMNKVDPLPQQNNPFRFYLMAMEGRRQELVQEMKLKFEQDTTSEVNRRRYIVSLVRAGDLETAQDISKGISSKSLSQRTSLYDRILSMTILGALGKAKEGLSCIDEDLIVGAKVGPQWAFELGQAYVACKMYDEGLDMLEAALNQGLLHYKLLSEYTPILEPLYGNQRFEDIVNRMKAAHAAFES